jgi:hypothetical protein
VAKIKIDLDRTIGTVDQRIYGGFIEHLGHCIYGSIFDEGSSLSDEHGFRRDVMEALRAFAGRTGAKLCLHVSGAFAYVAAIAHDVTCSRVLGVGAVFIMPCERRQARPSRLGSGRDECCLYTTGIASPDAPGFDWIASG